METLIEHFEEQSTVLDNKHYYSLRDIEKHFNEIFWQECDTLTCQEFEAKFLTDLKSGAGFSWGGA